jgi:dihydropteroate synthase
MTAAARAEGAIPAEPELPQRRSLDPALDIDPDHLWLRPLALLYGQAAHAALGEGRALRLAGGDAAFSMIELLGRSRTGEVVAALGGLDEARRWAAGRGGAATARLEHQLAALATPRAPWAGFSLDRPLIMGIVNATPDSFSDGGDFLAPERAIAHGRALAAAGADILDVGGESTRPGAAPVAPEEEIRRVEPVVRALAGAGLAVSIDTRHARTMAAAAAAGARIINDVSALAGEPESPAVAARSNAALVLMHMQGEPRTMQANPSYSLASLDIVEYLEGRLAACAVAGIERSRVVVDPGIGFGKHTEHNLEIMARLALLHALGTGVLLGISRKSLIAAVHHAEPKARVPGSLAGAIYALAQGVQILRVHDVAETRQAIATWRAVAESG